jgi:hypothetical protein
MGLSPRLLAFGLAPAAADLFGLATGEEEDLGLPPAVDFGLNGLIGLGPALDEREDGDSTLRGGDDGCWSRVEALAVGSIPSMLNLLLPEIPRPWLELSGESAEDADGDWRCCRFAEGDCVCCRLEGAGKLTAAVGDAKGDPREERRDLSPRGEVHGRFRVGLAVWDLTGLASLRCDIDFVGLASLRCEIDFVGLASLCETEFVGLASLRCDIDFVGLNLVGLASLCFDFVGLLDSLRCETDLVGLASWRGSGDGLLTRCSIGVSMERLRVEFGDWDRGGLMDLWGEVGAMECPGEVWWDEWWIDASAEWWIDSSVGETSPLPPCECLLASASLPNEAANSSSSCEVDCVAFAGDEQVENEPSREVDGYPPSEDGMLSAISSSSSSTSWAM